MILAREQIANAMSAIEVAEDEFGPWDEPSVLRGLQDTARAYHDMRDAVLALVHEYEGDSIIGAPWVVEEFREAVESVGGAR